MAEGRVGEQGRARDVAMDDVQLAQVMLNLLVNAIHALRDAPERRVRVVGQVAQDRVELRVSDTGPGVDPSVGQQIFHPFFSQREDGMGMGLAICRSIVAAHRGQLWYRRNKLGGAEFLFTLPRFEEGSNDVD